jgi:hypothetical protein
LASVTGSLTQESLGDAALEDEVEEPGMLLDKLPKRLLKGLLEGCLTDCCTERLLGTEMTVDD